MSGSRTDENSKLALALLLLALVLGAGAVILFPGKSDQPVAEVNPIDLKDEKKRRQIEATVNRHIQLTNRKIETEKEKIRIEAGFVIPKVGMQISRPYVPSGKDDGLDLRADKNEYNPVRDLDRRPPAATPNSAGAIVQSEMAEAQAQKALEEQYQKEYAKQFIEEARRNGYDVKVGPDYRVIEVRPLPSAIHEPPARAEGGALR